MRSIVTLLFLIGAFIGQLAGQSGGHYSLPPGCTSDDFLAGQVIIKFRSDVIDHEQNPRFIQALQVCGADSVVAKFPHSKIPEAQNNRWGQPNVNLRLIYEVYYSSEAGVPQTIDLLMSTGLLEYALPHFLPQLLYSPNDPNTSFQYSLTKISAYQAWDICKGDTNKVVGITDTGIDFAHPDLVNAVKYNHDDPIDGIDNDNDGFTDNYRGWDMGSWDNNPQFGLIGHGIHVSGISGASTDNSFGMAGSGFRCKVLPVKVDNQYGNLVATYESIVYAADHGADVINCSWGSSFSPGQYGQDIVNYATINCNALVVAAAGNSNSLNPFYPASYNYVLSVAATDVNDCKWANSSYGQFVDISAPGKDIHSTWAGSGFVNSSGTSMAAPCVAGAAALVSSYYPTLNMLQVAERLRTTADVIDTLSCNNGYFSYLGTGRLNMYRALTDTFSVSVRLDDYAFTDSSDMTYFPGDTLFVGINVINYLDTSSSALYARLECLTPEVQLIDSLWNIGVLHPMQQSSNSSTDPFVIQLLNVPPSTKIEFLVHFYDGPWHSADYLSTNVNKDYKTLDTNEIVLTITSAGNLAYNDINNFIQGEGFRFGQSASLVSGMGFMCGTSVLNISDNLYTLVGQSDSDFVAAQFVAEMIPATLGDQCFLSRYSDTGAGTSSSNRVTIHQYSYAWDGPMDENSVYFKYIIYNDSALTLNNLYAGFFADWDVTASEENRIWFDFSNDAMITTNSDTSILLAVKLLSNYQHYYYGADIDGYSGSIALNDGFTEGEKFNMMKTNRYIAGSGPEGNDVAVMAGTGPLTIFAGDSLELTWVVVAGNNIQEISEGIERAEIRYLDPQLMLERYDGSDVKLFPIPASETINYEIPDQFQLNEILIIQPDGRQVYYRQTSEQNGVIDVSGLQAGVYFFIVSGNENAISTVFSIVK